LHQVDFNRYFKRDFLRLRRGSFLVLLGIPVLMSFQNCGPQLVLAPFESEPASFSGSCESEIKNAFIQNYRPFLVAQCAGCHATGPGVGRFANSDFNTAWSEFRAIGIDRIEKNTVSPSHQPPVTGSHHQEAMNKFRQAYAEAQANFHSCQERQGITVDTKVLQTEGKAYSLINRTTWTTLEWDLESELILETKKGLFPVRFSIEAKHLVRNNQNIGYEFRNPSARLKRQVVGVRLKSLRLVVNESLVTNLTTYIHLDRVIDQMVFTNLFPSSGNAFVLRSVSTQDRFALHFEVAELATPPTGPGGAPAPGEPPLPTEPPLPNRVTYAQLTSNDPLLGVFSRHCVSCHNSGNKSGGLNLTNQVEATAKAATIRARMRNAADPMPTSGILDERLIKIVEIWVEKGTP
jgi:hypothetical protein